MTPEELKEYGPSVIGAILEAEQRAYEEGQKSVRGLCYTKAAEQDLKEAYERGRKEIDDWYGIQIPKIGNASRASGYAEGFNKARKMAMQIAESFACGTSNSTAAAECRNIKDAIQEMKMTDMDCRCCMDCLPKKTICSHCSPEAHSNKMPDAENSHEPK